MIEKTVFFFGQDQRALRAELQQFCQFDSKPVDQHIDLHQLNIIDIYAIDYPNQYLNQCVQTLLLDDHHARNGLTVVPDIAYVEPESSLNDLVNNHHGDYRLITYQHASKTMSFVVSPFHSVSFFYTFLDSGIIVSSNFDLLYQLCPHQADNLALSRWVLGRPDPHRSMFSKIKMVEPGCALSITAQGEASIQRVWDIAPKYVIVHASEAEYAHQLREILTQSLSDRINMQLPFVTQMSGGMDSTSLSALAHRLTLHSLTTGELTTHTHHTLSHSYSTSQDCDESGNITAMLQQFKFPQHHQLDMGRFTNMDFFDLYPTHAVNPGVVLSPKYSEEAQYLRGHNIRQVVTGNGGDEQCWGHHLIYLDRLMAGDIGVLPEIVKASRQLDYSLWRALKESVLKPFYHYHLQGKSVYDIINYQPPWLGASAKQVLANADDDHNVFDKDQLTKQFRYYGLTRTATFNSMRSYHTVGGQHGINVVHPFMDKNVAEFSFAIPQKLWLQGAYPKHLLRKAMTGILPDKVCWDVHKTTFDSHFGLLVRNSATTIRQLLQHEALHDEGIVDNQAALTSFDSFVADRDAPLQVDLLYLILTQSWYQEHVLGEQRS